MAAFKTVVIILRIGENSHFPVLKQMVKVQFCLDVIGK